jgi:Flp pilus assembly protein TadG
MLLQRLLKDRRGAVAPMFALAVVPVIGFIGAAVDYSRANAVKAGMQSALDATALAMAKLAPTLTSADLQTKSNAYFQAMFSHPEAKGVTITPSYTTTGGSQLTLAGSASVDTSFMKVMGYTTLDIKSTATVKWGNNRLRVALALDNTGSMASAGKIDALKTATKSLLDQLKAAAANNGDVYVSIIPFSKNVNVGTATYTNANWIDWEDWDDDNGHDQSSTTCSTQKSGKNGKKKKKCTTTTTWVPDNHNTWNGCITDRDKDFDTKNTVPNPADKSLPPGQASTLFPAEQGSDCPAKMMGLSYDWLALKNKIDELQPDGYTNQGIGLAWAWMALTPGGPLNPPAKTADTQQAIILFSDGLNTENRWYQTQQPIDNRQAIACANAKAAGITIYTVLVNSGFSQVMKDCASKPEFYFEVTAGQTVTAFNAIGTSLTKLRLAE